MDCLASLAIAARQADKANDGIIAELACLKFMVQSTDKVATQLSKLRQMKDSACDRLRSTRERIAKMQEDERQIANELEAIQNNIAEVKELEQYETDDIQVDGDWIGVGMPFQPPPAAHHHQGHGFPVPPGPVPGPPGNAMTM